MRSATAWWPFVGSTAAPSATFGSVVSLGARSLTVEWHGRAGTWRGDVGPEHARSLGYGYATTVPYLRSLDPGAQRLIVLGDPLELAGRSAQAGAAWVTVPGPGFPAFGPSGLFARRRAALTELATSWPDHEMLDLAGPRPLALARRRQWAEVVVSCAIAARPRPGQRITAMRDGRPPTLARRSPHLDVAGRS